MERTKQWDRCGSRGPAPVSMAGVDIHLLVAIKLPGVETSQSSLAQVIMSKLLTASASYGL